MQNENGNGKQNAKGWETKRAWEREEKAESQKTFGACALVWQLRFLKFFDHLLDYSTVINWQEIQFLISILSQPHIGLFLKHPYKLTMRNPR